MNVNRTVNSAFVLSCSTSFHAVQASKQEEEGQNLETKHRYLEVMAERCQGRTVDVEHIYVIATACQVATANLEMKKVITPRYNSTANPTACKILKKSVGPP